MNNRYIFRVRDPQIFPGWEIETVASEKYAVAVAQKLMEIVREISKVIPRIGKEPKEPKEKIKEEYARGDQKGKV